MEKVKIRDVKVGAVIEVAKDIASDYIATKNFEIYKEEAKTLFNKSKNESMKND